MALSVETAWTNKTLDVLRSHALDRGIPQALCAGTVQRGIRMLSRQSKSSAGRRHIRLDGWYYIRRLSVDDVLRSLPPGLGLRQEISRAMADQAVYHVVVRGNDPKFMPPGDLAGTDVVTTFLVENMQDLHDEVERSLFDELAAPAGIVESMENPIFDSMLEAYYKSGDISGEDNLHLVARFRGGSNLLHRCIKDGSLDTLRLLLNEYTAESQLRTPWRVLAEPMRPHGVHRVSAFHRAVYDGRPDCLTELLSWAKCHGHDVTSLKNVEERSSSAAPSLEMTCLQLAEKEQNFECYNVLAEVFGVSKKDDGRDEQTRETRHEVSSLPRVEVLQAQSRGGPAEVLAMEPVTEASWSAVLAALRVALKGKHCAGSAGWLHLKISNIEFTEDVTEEEAADIMDFGSKCDMICAERCVVFSDRTLVAILRVLVDRLSDEAGSGGVVPVRVHLHSKVAQSLPIEEEASCDLEAAELLCGLVARMGCRPKFLGARNGIISAQQSQRLSAVSSSNGWAAFCAARHANRIAAFFAFLTEDQEGIEDWLQQRAFLPCAREILGTFFDRSMLISKEFVDPRDALDIRSVTFLEMVLRSWFALARDEEFAWRKWGERLGVDEETMLRRLAPALDLLLESLLRMDCVIDHALKKRGDGGSISSLVESIVPRCLLHRLPDTRQGLVDRPELASKHGAAIAGGLLQSPAALRPRWAMKRTVLKGAVPKGTAL